MTEIFKHSVDKRLHRRIGRIAARVALFSTLSTVAYGTIDYVGARIRWNENDTYAVQTRDNNDTRDDEALLILAGFGNKNGIKIADSIAPAVPDKFTMGAMTYSDEAAVDMGKGVDAGKDLADQILIFAKNEHVQRLSLYLHSMADEMFLQALPHLQGLTIDTLVLDCSPFDINTVYKHEVVEKGADFPLPFGIISKTLWEINEATRGEDRNESLSWTEAVSDGVRISLDGSSPFLARNNAKVLAYTNPKAFIDYFKDIRRVVYLMPENPSNDHTIDTVLASSEWKALLGNKLEIIRIPKGGHADPMYRTEEYQAVISQIFPEPAAPPPIAIKLDTLLNKM